MLNFTTISQAKNQIGLSYLGTVNSSSKLMKNQKVNMQYTYAIYLAPANTSGYNVCSHSTNEYRLGCLATSGRQAIEIFSGIDSIKNARIQKTKLYYEEPDFLLQGLIV